MNERFIKIINYILDMKIEFSQNDIAKKLGISSGYISELTQSKKAISKRVVSELASAYPQFDINWLKIGEGEMLKKNCGQLTVNNVNGDNIGCGHDNTINNSDVAIHALIEQMKVKDVQISKSQDQISIQQEQITKSQDQISKSQEQIDRLISLLEKEKGR